MKGTEAEYIVPLRNAFDKPVTKRPGKALNELKRFVWKHARSKNVVLTTDLNEFIWARSKRKVPRKLPVLLRKEGNKVIVYLQGSKQIEADKKTREEKEKKKRETEKKKKEEEKKKKKEKTDEEKEKERKKKEKKEKEKSAEKMEIKRKIKNK